MKKIVLFLAIFAHTATYPMAFVKKVWGKFWQRDPRIPPLSYDSDSDNDCYEGRRSTEITRPTQIPASEKQNNTSFERDKGESDPNR